jgi:uncharacterized RDD family membrane protein YckC
MASAAIHDAMAASDQPIEIAVHRFARPVPLGASEVGRGPPVKPCHRQNLRWGEAVEVAGAGAGDQVLEPVPVVSAAQNELLATHRSQNNPMEQPLSDTDLVVSTPERVAFDYQVAGLGTRGIAQILDLLIVTGLLIAVFFFASGVAAYTQSSTLAILIELFGSFVIVFGYFWISEALFSGQTLGKRAFRLRVVGDRGEPMTWVQAGIRNVIRIVDFLPYGYGVGLIVLFANGRGKRLGDLAAGTIVVKDSDSIGLWQLGRAAFRMPPPPPPPPGPPPGAPSQYPAQPPPPPPPPPTGYVYAQTPFMPASQAELILRRLDPDLRRFVSAYARRRPQLPLEMRVQLASTVQASLRTALPDVFAQRGPLAALDQLANLEGQ